MDVVWTCRNRIQVTNPPGFPTALVYPRFGDKVRRARKHPKTQPRVLTANHCGMKTKHNVQAKQIQTNQYKPKPKGEEAAPSASESTETSAPETTAGCEPAAQPRTRKQRGFAGLKTPFPSAEMTV